MSNLKHLQVYSEIGKLKSVLVHRPGPEVSNLIPDYFSELLFDDVPFLEVAQQEHDVFTKTLTSLGVEVHDIEKLFLEALNTSKKACEEYIKMFLSIVELPTHYHRELLQELLSSCSPLDLKKKTIEGLLVEELKDDNKSLCSRVIQSYPYLITPSPNLLFTRDPFASVGKGIIVNSMRWNVRRKETAIVLTIFNHHPLFSKLPIPRWYNADGTMPYSIEGGDVCILNQETIAIGVSERTCASAIEFVTKSLFDSDEPFKQILALEFPKKRAFMHLDTVFTQVDHKKFSYFGALDESLRIHVLKKANNSLGFTVDTTESTFQACLEKYFGSVTMIPCANNHPIHKHVEQWNDGSNTLAVAPGEAVVYSRNTITNKALQDAGIKLHIIPSSELSRGRGGPRCMSMPFFRELL